jgi:hypothetical protein
MPAPSPLDSLATVSNTAAMPHPKYPVGTQLDLAKIPLCDQAYYKKTVRRTLIRRLRQSLNRLQAQGYLEEMRGKKMLAGNKAALRDIFLFMETADTVEVAGHQPTGLHSVGSIVNECYLQGGSSFSGTSFSYFLLFRKKDAEGRNLVCIYPDALLDEGRVGSCVIRN